MRGSVRYWVAMPAAGQGMRLGSEIPKQYLEVAARPLIAWSLQVFLGDPRCLGVVVATAPGDPHWAGVRDRLGCALIDAVGGAQRGDSVAAALGALLARGAAPTDWVLVHDAARPCLTPHEVDALLHAIEDHPDGGLLALPLADTLKRAQPVSVPTCSAMPEVAQTEPREGLWRALTPQAFRLASLRDALAAAAGAGRSPTDESQAMEWAGYRPRLVPGAATNFKVTTRSDLELAAAILGWRSTGGSGS